MCFVDCSALYSQVYNMPGFPMVFSLFSAHSQHADDSACLAAKIRLVATAIDQLFVARCRLTSLL